MGQRADAAPAPPAAPADAGAARTGTWQPPAVTGPRSFPESHEQRKRERPGLTQGIRQRLLRMCSAQRAARGEADAIGARREEVIHDLMRARQRLTTLRDAFTRRAWLDKGQAGQQQGELDTQQQHVERLQAELDRLTQQQNAAAQRAAVLRATIGRVGASHALGKGRAVFTGLEPDYCDVDLLEERLLQ
jgi:DNA repair exonuclease SbcCD ATPase subunit